MQQWSTVFVQICWAHLLCPVLFAAGSNKGRKVGQFRVHPAFIFERLPRAGFPTATWASRCRWTVNFHVFLSGFRPHPQVELELGQFISSHQVSGLGSSHLASPRAGLLQNRVLTSISKFLLLLPEAGGVSSGTYHENLTEVLEVNSKLRLPAAMTALPGAFASQSRPHRAQRPPSPVQASHLGPGSPPGAHLRICCEPRLPGFTCGLSSLGGSGLSCVLPPLTDPMKVVDSSVRLAFYLFG